MAGYLDDSPENSPVAIGGWSPATLDAPTIYLSMQRQDLEPRFFGSDSLTKPVSTLIIPGWGDAASKQQPATASDTRLFRPAIRDLSPGIEAQLAEWKSSLQDMDTFAIYRLSMPAEFQAGAATAKRFDDQIELIGYKLPDNRAGCIHEDCSILTYWRVLVPVEDPRRFFLHAMDSDELIGQHDGLDAPAVLLAGDIDERDGVVDVGHGYAGVLDRALEGSPRPLHEIGRHALELRTGQRLEQMDRAVLVRGDERQVDLRRLHGLKLDLRLLRSLLQPREGHRVLGEVDAVL